ncbi:MAG TPA: HAMP domain-containing sensor histidine kinase [Puia sp.]|nr:HAMP domain-containing sensor histidine kinase [Puia sp.]
MKLLNRTIRSYLFYSFTILLVAIPLFYFVVKTVLFHSVDRSLKTQMRDIRSNLPSISSAKELETWSKMDKDILLAPAEKTAPDRIYTIYRSNRRHHDEDPYREISGTIVVERKIYKLIITNSLVENEDLLGSIVMVQAFLLILLMAGMLWINQLSSKKIWKPFYAALDNMKNYELGNHIPPAAVRTNIDEFKELNEAIKQMINRNLEVYLAQKEFTENASHEMQTPLAIFQGKIELLMQTQPLSEEQAGLISALEEANLRLVRLNKSLLLLSRIENNQFPLTEQVDLKILVSQVLEQYRPKAELHQIHITEDYPDDLLLDANKTLIEMLVGNLISNAIRYNVDNGKISIELRHGTLVIRNFGPANPLPAGKIFERFYKSGEQNGSIGLGLAIVRKICDLYHYRLDYQFTEGWHVFRVTP